VAALKALLRYISYFFHLLLTLFLLGISGLALVSGTHSLHLLMLPWTGSTLTYVVFFGALFGLLSLILAVRGTLRPLFFLWTLVVFVMLVKGYAFGGYRFAPGEASKAGYLLVGSFLSLIGAWFAMWRVADRKRY